LASATASSTSLYFRIEMTGPKISSREMRISGVTSANTVGSTKNPSSRPSFRPAARPPVVARAPSAWPDSTYSITVRNWEAVATGPNTVCGSSGSPCRPAAMVAVTRSTTSP